MRPIRALIALAAAAWLAGAPAFAQAVVTSAGPDSVTVAIYRDPDRSADQRISGMWLEGYALITEKRTVTIPAGKSVIRFEGVAGGMLPESAIVTDLPQGVREKNLDADLLSPYSLYARSLGRPVQIRRQKGDAIVLTRGIIRSGPDGAAVIETAEGIEAVNCDAPADTILYPEVPAGLSAKPTLSVETESAAPVQVTLTLAYLAWGFDWQADYVATIRPDGKSADLFAWVTLASQDVSSFADAQTMVIAGKVNRESDADDAPRYFTRPLTFQCYPAYVDEDEDFADKVDSITAEDVGAFPAAPATIAEALMRVTGVRMATQEELGDLKLYRVPEPTTVASQSQKQVALMDREGVPVDVIYRAYIVEDGEMEVRLLLRAQNRKTEGLGLALPAGGVAVFEPYRDTRLLVGEGSISDKAEGEEVEVPFAESTQVQVRRTLVRERGRRRDFELVVTNARPSPVRFEGDFMMADGDTLRFATRIGRKNGRDLWSVEVPANGTARLKYSVTKKKR